MDFTIVIDYTLHSPGNILDYSNPRNSIAQQVIYSRKGTTPSSSSLSHSSCKNVFLPLPPYQACQSASAPCTSGWRSASASPLKALVCPATSSCAYVHPYRPATGFISTPFELKMTPAGSCSKLKF